MTDENVNLPVGFFNTLYDFQRDGVEWLMSVCNGSNNNNKMLADEMGLGAYYLFILCR